MPRTKKNQEPNSQPDSLTELAPIVQEFVSRLKTLENEEEELKLQKKELIEEYSEKLDTKTLKLALRFAAIRDKVEHKDTFDKFVEILETTV